MFSRLHTFIGGTHIDAAKNLTAELPIEAIPAPEKVVLPLSMHIGAPAKPLVQPGEKVYLWTKDRRSPGSSQQQYPCQCQRHGRWQRKTLSSQRHRRGLYGHQK